MKKIFFFAGAFLFSNMLNQVYAMKNQQLSLVNMSQQTQIIGFLYTELKNIASENIFEIGVMIVNGGITGTLQFNEIMNILKTADQIRLVINLAFQYYPNLEIHIKDADLEKPKISNILKIGKVTFIN
jgi:hypothetical protein